MNKNDPAPDFLKINLLMALPEGFKGSFRDAVMLYLDAREGLPEAETRIRDPRMVSVRMNHEAFYVNQRYGARILCDDGIWSTKSGDYRDLAKSPKGAILQGRVWAK